jgi:uncharacterized coiled-coil protein SlyX
MFISKKRFQELEKRIDALEQKEQERNKNVDCISHQITQVIEKHINYDQLMTKKGSTRKA